MAIKKLRESDFSTSYFDEEFKIGGIDWKEGKLKSEEYKETFMSVVGFFKKKTIEQTL